MDSDAFQRWLVGIRRLDVLQRRRVFEALALAEADAPGAPQADEAVRPRQFRQSCAQEPSMPLPLRICNCSTRYAVMAAV